MPLHIFHNMLLQFYHSPSSLKKRSPLGIVICCFSTFTLFPCAFASKRSAACQSNIIPNAISLRIPWKLKFNRTKWKRLRFKLPYLLRRIVNPHSLSWLFHFPRIYFYYPYFISLSLSFPFVASPSRTSFDWPRSTIQQEFPFCGLLWVTIKVPSFSHETFVPKTLHRFTKRKNPHSLNILNLQNIIAKELLTFCKSNEVARRM